MATAHIEATKNMHQLLRIDYTLQISTKMAANIKIEQRMKRARVATSAIANHSINYQSGRNSHNRSYEQPKNSHVLNEKTGKYPYSELLAMLMSRPKPSRHSRDKDPFHRHQSMNTIIAADDLDYKPQPHNNQRPKKPINQRLLRHIKYSQSAQFIGNESPQCSDQHSEEEQSTMGNFRLGTVEASDREIELVDGGLEEGKAGEADEVTLASTQHRIKVVNDSLTKANTHIFHKMRLFGSELQVKTASKPSQPKKGPQPPDIIRRNIGNIRQGNRQRLVQEGRGAELFKRLDLQQLLEKRGGREETGISVSGATSGHRWNDLHSGDGQSKGKAVVTIDSITGAGGSGEMSVLNVPENEWRPPDTSRDIDEDKLFDSLPMNSPLRHIQLPSRILRSKAYDLKRKPLEFLDEYEQRLTDFIIEIFGNRTRLKEEKDYELKLKQIERPSSVEEYLSAIVLASKADDGRRN